MRIVSKIRDYYDSIQGLGQDQSLVYVREPVVDKMKSWSFASAPGSYYSWRGESKALQHVIGFCGIVYPCLRFWKPSEPTGEMSSDYVDPAIYCYSIEDVDKYFEKYAPKKEAEAYFEKQTRRNRYFYSRVENQAGYKKFFDEFAKTLDKHGDKFTYSKPNPNKNSSKPFVNLTVPIFIATHWANKDAENRLQSVAIYESMNFMRIKDPYTAFQDLRMWMSNQASPERPIPEMSNENLINAHGFDKYSFRKDKSK